MAILNVTTGQIYGTIAEAARAAGVDASNIGKNLRGARKSAGGYVFQRVAQAPTAAEYEKLLAQSRAALTPQEVRARQKSRARSEQRAAATPPKPRRPAATPETRAAREKARAAMIKANAAARKAKKAGDMALYDKIRQAAERAGLQSKTGLYDTRRGSMADISADALRAIGKAAREAATGDAQAYIYQARYGLASVAEAQAKKEALDAMSEAMGNLREMKKRVDGTRAYGEVYSELQIDASTMTNEELLELADRINEMVKELRDDLKAEIDSIEDVWSKDEQEEAREDIKAKYSEKFDDATQNLLDDWRKKMDAKKAGEEDEDDAPITW